MTSNKSRRTCRDREKSSTRRATRSAQHDEHSTDQVGAGKAFAPPAAARCVPLLCNRLTLACEKPPFSFVCCPLSRCLSYPLQRKDSIFVTISLPDVAEEKVELTGELLKFT